MKNIRCFALDLQVQCCDKSGIAKGVYYSIASDVSLAERRTREIDGK